MNVNCTTEQAVINERFVDKQIEVIVERPFPVYREVEVPVDIIIERPIEKIV
jgi:hypothetical protein